jgi:luciferase family oxidoreductase group 1
MRKIKLSVLDEAIILEGHSIKEVFERSVKEALYVEELGYERVWFAEHHNMANIASAATSLLIAHIAGRTTRIRVGSGGIMLPNHAPLLVAEQFGTLETFYPNRIDLGVGRAPGADRETTMAVRRNNMNAAAYFEEDILSIQKYFSNTNPQEKIRAFPGEGANVPMYILGSSINSAQLAAKLGLPYVFAAHFAPTMLQPAAEIYRKTFKPSIYASAPYLIACVNIIASSSNEEAYDLSSSLYNLLSGVITNEPHLLSAPTGKLRYEGNLHVEESMQQLTAATFIGDQETIAREVTLFTDRYQVDEIMMTNYVYDHQKKLESFKISKDALNHLI